MPEGDTLYRTAAVLARVLVGKEVTAARGRAGGAALGRLVGRRVEAVEARGKHLLMRFSTAADGPPLTLHTHLRMHGSWHRYRPGERWRQSPDRAVAVIETADAVAVCFGAPTVELLETRAVAIHPVLARLGPDLLAPQPDIGSAVARLRHETRAEVAVGDALLDQAALAGLGNVYRSEVCFVERVDPFTPVERVADEALRRLVRTGAELLAANRHGGARTTMPDAMGAPPGAGMRRPPDARLWVYGRAGRPCRRCGTLIHARSAGPLARRVYWCPGCQVARAATSRCGPRPAG